MRQAARLQLKREPLGRSVASMTSATIRLALVRAGLMTLWLPIMLGAPLLVTAFPRLLPAPVENFLFFWPQAALPLQTFHGAPPQVGAHVWPGWWAFYWLAVIAGFSLGARRLRPLWAFVGAGLVIVAFTMILHLVIRVSGLYFELQGP
jgi:hypothetical protein